MAKFLNTKGLSEWIPTIIDQSKSELVIISPFLQLSDTIYSCLLSANNRGVEIIIIYRENKISDIDKAKLTALENLNLMHHPNVHAKCFYNESYLLIASMNLYEYSEKNNREMGILFRGSVTTNAFTSEDSDIFEDALNEISTIITSSDMTNRSQKTIKDSFEMEILKSKRERQEDKLKVLNKIFGHKKFEFDYTYGEEPCNYECKNYIDKVDVKINSNIEFDLNFDPYKVNQLYALHHINKKQLEFKFDGFKLYWNRPEKIDLYENRKHYLWKRNINEKEVMNLWKKGIDEVIEFIKVNRKSIY
ncbi:MAG: phospholipase D family protein [Candidatus Paceibacterota bacterium]